MTRRPRRDDTRRGRPTEPRTRGSYSVWHIHVPPHGTAYGKPIIPPSNMCHSRTSVLLSVWQHDQSTRAYLYSQRQTPTPLISSCRHLPIPSFVALRVSALENCKHTSLLSWSYLRRDYSLPAALQAFKQINAVVQRLSMLACIAGTGRVAHNLESWSRILRNLLANSTQHTPNECLLEGEP